MNIALRIELNSPLTACSPPDNAPPTTAVNAAAGASPLTRLVAADGATTRFLFGGCWLLTHTGRLRYTDRMARDDGQQET